MGYTVYFSFKAPPKGRASQTEALYQAAILDCQRFLVRYNMALPNGSPERLSGYSAHCKPGQYGGIKINGTSEYSCEDFVLREHMSQNESSWCKTNRQSYTIAVLGCLYLLKRRLGDLVQIDTDGCDSELFSEARKLIVALSGFKRYTEIEPEQRNG